MGEQSFSGAASGNLPYSTQPYGQPVQYNPQPAYAQPPNWQNPALNQPRKKMPIGLVLTLIFGGIFMLLMLGCGLGTFFMFRSIKSATQAEVDKLNNSPFMRDSAIDPDKNLPTAIPSIASSELLPHRESDPWIVLSNFKITKKDSIQGTVSVDWKVVQGNLNPGCKMFLETRRAGSSYVQLHAFDFGNSQTGKSGTFRGKMPFGLVSLNNAENVLFVGAQGTMLTNVHRVSGYVSVGGAPSDSQPIEPASVVDGSAVQGKPITIANGVVESENRRQTFSIDYEVAKRPEGFRFFWIVQSTVDDRKVEIDITPRMLTQVVKTGTITGSDRFGNALKTPVKMHIESRGVGFQAAAEIVSNELTVE
jgi:hypothetical protein